MNDQTKIPCSESAARTCGNCACFFQMPHPFNELEKTPVCRRNQAMLAQAEGQMPRMRLGHPVMDKEGKPLMEKVTKQIWVYPATHEGSVCFDGWRPIGMEPGERLPASMGEILKEMEPILNALGVFKVTMPLDG